VNSGVNNLNRDNIGDERIYGKLEKEPLPKSPLIQLERRQRNGLIPSEKPFDILTEGLLFRNSRGDRTAIELFLGGIKTLASQLSIPRQVLVAILDSSCSEQPSS
jgi:hypothetical protein